MAKTKLPLISLEARGQIGKALVYFPWKGINAVREYVIPTNPKTDAQIAQRNILKEGVQAWHDAEYTAADHEGWERYAGVLAKPMTGFNAMVRRYITVRLIPKTWQTLRDLKVDTPGLTVLELSVHSDEITQPPVFSISTTKTYFPPGEEMSYHEPSDRWVRAHGGLTPDTRYFFFVRQTNPAFDGYTGIHSTKTL